MAGPADKDVKAPGATDERTTERKLVASSVMHAAVDPPRDAHHDASGEDFLFHLYRGSELLQDDRVHEAKDELEKALRLQPRDPKGQDLLAVVYFRLGHYPRAIQIYEQLKRDNPRDPSLKLNLALCYLKIGQAVQAKNELEDVVRLHPTHKRAWGYLGLALERCGELEKAMAALERAGHAQLVRRLQDKLAVKGSPMTIPVSSASNVASPLEAEAVRNVAQAAFEELDAGEISFALAEPVTGSHQESGTWKTMEPGAPTTSRRSVLQSGDGWTVPPTAEGVASRQAEELISQRSPGALVPPNAPMGAGLPVALAPHEPATPHPPPLFHEVARAARIALPATPGVLLHPNGTALVRTAGSDGPHARPFAVRLESIRVHAGALATEVLPRQAHGKATGESFGGVASPVVRVSGPGEILIAPRPSHTIVGFQLEGGDALTVREDALLGFELGAIAYESAKLPVGDGDSAHVVQLRGAGAVLLELLDKLQALDVTEGHTVMIRREALVAWTGRVAPRALTPTEAPGGQRGLLGLAGEGVVLLTSA